MTNPRIDLHLETARVRRKQADASLLLTAAQRRQILLDDAEIHTTLAAILVRLDCLDDEPAIAALAKRIERLENARKGVISVGGGIDDRVPYGPGGRR